MLSIRKFFMAIQDLFEGDSEMQQLNARLKFYQQKLDEVARSQEVISNELLKTTYDLRSVAELLNNKSTEFSETMNMLQQISSLTEQLRHSNDSLSDVINTNKKIQEKTNA